MECAGQHQGEETVTVGGKGERRGREGATAGGMEGGRGGGGGAAPRPRGGAPGNNKEGAKGRKAKQWGKDSAGEYVRLDAQ